MINNTIKLLLTFCLGLFIIGCSSSQYTMFKPSDNESAWKVEVNKSGDSFELIIDGQELLDESFSFFYGKEFEASGEFRGHRVHMFGYRRYDNDYQGKLIEHDRIRVLIDDKEIGVFEF